MKAKLKVIKNWEFEEFELTGTSFKYSPTGCKGMVARSEDEIVFWTYHLVQKCSGVCGSKAKFPGGFPARSRKSSKMFGKILSCSHATEEYCWFARPVNPFGGCRRWMESGFRSPWITGVPRVFPSRWQSPEARAFSLLCAEWTTPLMRPTVLPA